MNESRFKIILALMLVYCLFAERFCFLAMVYQTQCTNYVLLMTVIFVNTFIFYLVKGIKHEKVNKKMH